MKTLTEEHKRKISLANKGKIVSEITKEKMRKNSWSKHGIVPSMLGKHHSTETKTLMSISARGKNKSDEHRKNISIANKGKVRSKEFIEKCRLNHLGLKLSEETKRKISESLKGKKLSEETKLKMKENNKNNPNAGMKNKHHSIETKKKIGFANSISLKGTHQSEETKRKKSISFKGKNIWIKGRHHSEEAKIKISNFQKGKVISEETKNRMSLNNARYWKGKKKSPFSEEHKRKLKIVRSKRIFPLKDTTIEVKIQNFLKILGIDFFTHQYMKEINHAYQCDIFIPSKNLIIECDGNYWHHYPTGNEVDQIRTSELIEKGFKVLRLWEIEIRSMTIDDLNNKLNEINNI